MKCRSLRVLLALTALSLPGLAGAMPGFNLNVIPSTVLPGGELAVDIGYIGDAGVATATVELAFDRSVFSVALVSCGRSAAGTVGVTCSETSAGGGVLLQARAPADGALAGDFVLGRVLLRVLDTARPEPTEIQLVRARFADDMGTTIAGVTDQPTTVTVLQSLAFSELSLAVGSAGGDALIFPYITSVGQRASAFVIENRSPRAKVIRLNFRDGVDGSQLIDEPVDTEFADSLNLYLESGGRARFLVANARATGETRLFGSGCTYPRIPAGGLTLGMPDVLVGKNADTSKGPPQGEEGFVTALVMSDLDTIAGAQLRVSGCDSLLTRFETLGVWVQDPLANTADPIGRIAGVYSIRGLEGITGAEDAAVSLQGFNTGSAHRVPWRAYTLNDARTLVRRDGTTRAYNSGAEAVSAALMTASRGLQVRPAGTEWFFSFPTKWFLTDVAGGLTTSPPLPPFNEAFGPGGACDPVLIAPGSPMPLPRDFCFSLAAVPFGSGSLFDSTFAVAPVVSPLPFRTVIGFSGTGLVDQQLSARLEGLPVIARAVPYRAGINRRLQGVTGLAAPVQLPGQATADKGPPAEPPAQGASVAISGRLVFVGAPGANDGRGAVFVFRRHGTRFVLEATLEIPPELAGAAFGEALAADGTEVLVGAPGDPELMGPGRKGTETMQAALWDRLNGQWNLKTPITTMGPHDAQFGAAVSMDGDVFAVGAPGDDSMAPDGGAVFVYDQTGLVNTVMPMQADQQGQFGSSIALKGGVLGVGSPIAVVSGLTAGSVSIYGQVTGNLQMFDTVAHDTPGSGQSFGAQLVFNGSQLAIGAPGVTVNDSAAAGEVQVWDFDGAGLVTPQVLQPPDAIFDGAFGTGLGFTDDGGFLAIGAPGAVGIGGEGALYEYTLVGGELLFDGKTSPDTLDDPPGAKGVEDPGIVGFGTSVATDGEVIIIGAPETAAEAGAALAVVDAEILFFDDYETELLQ